MEAYLTVSDGHYHLDWNNNSLDSKPTLFTNGEQNKEWSLFDILFDVIRVNHISLVRCNSLTLKDNLLSAYSEWLEDIYNFAFSLGCLQFLIDKSVDCLEFGDVWSSKCIVTNIDYGE